MAASCSSRAAHFTSTLLTRSSSSSSSPSTTNSAASKLRSLCCAKPSSSTPRLAFSNLKPSRLPVELGGSQSMMPLHSVTASALLNSLLSSTATWGTLSEAVSSTQELFKSVCESCGASSEGQRAFGLHLLTMLQIVIVSLFL